MDDTNKNKKTEYAFPNADRPLGSKEVTRGPVNPINNNEKDTVKFKDVMEQETSQFLSNETSISPIETYNGDVSIALKKDNMSALQIALAEQRKQQERQDVGEVVNQKSSGLFAKILMILLLLAVIIGGYLWWAGYLVPNSNDINNGTQEKNTVITQNQISIKIEKRQILPVDGKDPVSVINYLMRAKSEDVDLATVKEIILGSQNGTQGTSTVQKISTSEWFGRLGTHASPQLIRSLGDDYIFGVYGDALKDTFLILNVKSYDSAFAGMLSWESYMNDDIGDLIARDTSTLPVAPTLATSTKSKKSATTSLVRTDITDQKVFTDRIIFNKDSRILYEPNGQSRMLYSFIDPKTLVIVSSEAGLREIISRLTTGKITR
ncbi:MAG: hypothetical protein WCG97_00975 [bacterium]